MPILLTANHGVAYIDPLTPLTQLAEATRLAAESVDAALERGGFTPTPGYPRGRRARAKRDTAMNLVANASGTGLQTPNTAEFLIVQSDPFACAAGRQYEVLLTMPQVGGAATDRGKVSIYRDGAGGGSLMKSYFGLVPNGLPITVRAEFTVPADGTRVVNATLGRDVGSAAFFAFAATDSPILLTVTDVGAAA